MILSKQLKKLLSTIVFLVYPLCIIKFWFQKFYNQFCDLWLPKNNNNNNNNNKVKCRPLRHYVLAGKNWPDEPVCDQNLIVNSTLKGFWWPMKRGISDETSNKRVAISRHRFLHHHQYLLSQTIPVRCSNKQQFLLPKKQVICFLGSWLIVSKIRNVLLWKQLLKRLSSYNFMNSVLETSKLKDNVRLSYSLLLYVLSHLITHISFPNSHMKDKMITEDACVPKCSLCHSKFLASYQKQRTSVSTLYKSETRLQFAV